MVSQQLTGYQRTLMRDENVLPRAGTPTNHYHYVPTSHETIRHDSLSGLGYDWSKIADPGIPAKPPFKVYLPRTTEDVVRAVQEARESGEPLVVRGHGHSSNNLVTPDHGAVLLTELLNRIVAVDEQSMTVTMQAGATLMAVDLHLSEAGLGLSIIGDHDHITAAGFASVGGISPASHRYGMFVDTVVAMEYVDWEGKVHRCSRTDGTEDLLRLLAGTGRHGIITELTVRMIRVDKFRTVYANRRHLTTDINDFVRYSNAMIRDPGDAVMERGVWADFAVPGLSGVSLKVGQFSSYHNTSQRWYKSRWNDIAYGFQHLLGDWAGRLPAVVDDLAKYVGMGCIMLSPSYAGMKNIERFTDQILDSTVGDPTRMFVVLAPVDRYESLFYQLYELCVAERKRTGAITFISVYVKSIHSPYLAGTAAGAGDHSQDPRFCELMLYLGVHPDRMTPPILERLVGRIDQLVAASGAFRYLHSLTSTDPAIREKVDANAQYERSSAATPKRSGGEVAVRADHKPAKSASS
jgi:hypothetical protein